MQRIQALGEIGFEVFSGQTFIHQSISKEAKKLYSLNLSYRQIGRALKVNDKTAKMAVVYLATQSRKLP